MAELPVERATQPASGRPALRQLAVWAAVCVAAMIVFFGPTDNWLWDPSFYYAQLRSPIVDDDLNFRNETVMSGEPIADTPNGLQGNSWPIGPSIFWSPFFLLAHILVSLAAPAQATGFTFLYIALVSFASVLYGALGLLLVYQTCRHYGDRFISAVATLLCLAGAPLFYYMFRQPIMAHSVSFMVSAAFVFYFIKLSGGRYPRSTSGFIFGVLLGLSFLTRWSGILWAVLPIFYYARDLLAADQPGRASRLRFTLGQGLILAITCLLTISPQLVMWQRLYGTLLVIPQAGGFVASVFPINFIKVVFDTNRGLLFWSPFLVIGLLGVFRLPQREIKAALLTFTLLHTLLIGYRIDWHGAGGFGPRYFIELLPIAAVGLVCLARELLARPAIKLVVIAGTLLLIAHQAVLVYGVEHGSQGWLNLADYLAGRPIGLQWQLDAFLRLAAQPGLWLAPRPQVIQSSQTMLVNVLRGVRDRASYLTTGTVALAAFVAAAAAWRLRRPAARFHLLAVLIGSLAYALAWAAFLMTVG